MAFDFKKEFKQQYQPPRKPVIVDIPSMNYIAVRGEGNPNEEDGAYQKAVSILYAIEYTIKMSYRGKHQIPGFYEYAIPPLEGFWWQDHIDGVDYGHKENFKWISVLRLPDFVTEEEFAWAAAQAAVKKKMDCSSAEFLTVTEGLCVQMMHLGTFDEEPATVAAMNQFLEENGYENDITDARLHHEIYLGDPRKTDVSKRKTVIRHPVKKVIK